MTGWLAIPPLRVALESPAVIFGITESCRFPSSLAQSNSAPMTSPQEPPDDSIDKRPRVLCVDDEPYVLESLASLLGRSYEVVGAQSAADGLAILRQPEPFAVVLTDMLMPDTDGASFLEQVRQLSPHTVRLLLTGRSDLDTAIQGVNRGRIFRFLTKPCPSEELRGAVAAAAEQYRLVTAEQELLEQTLRGSIHVLTEMLSLTNPLAFSRARRVQRLVRHMIPCFGKEQAWELDVTAMLSQIGLVTVPGDVLEKVDHGLMLTHEEKQVYGRYPQVGADIIGRIPRLETVAESIGLQQTRLDQYRSNGLCRELPLGARILKAVMDFEERAAAGLDPRAVLREMKARRGWYDQQVLGALEQAVEHLDRGSVLRELPVDELSSGMILNQPLKTVKGALLIDKGQELTVSHLLRLANFAKFENIRGPVSVLVPSSLRARMAP
jgi:response regulator RpfG family c-di-GMP phosphodiesterase